MKYLAIAIIYASFFTLIGFVVHYTGSAMPLWALIFTPKISIKKWLKNDKPKKKKEKEFTLKGTE